MVIILINNQSSDDASANVIVKQFTIIFITINNNLLIGRTAKEAVDTNSITYWVTESSICTCIFVYYLLTQNSKFNIVFIM